MSVQKLELKHVAPYLPYNLHCKFMGQDNPDETYVLSGLDDGWASFYIEDSQVLEDVVPVLRPLDDLTKPIEHNGEVLIPYWRIAEKHLKLTGMEMPKHTFEQLESPKGYDYLPHWIFQDLIKWHFDLFWLIPSGLAIDINTLQNTLK